jgi:hypothetical protein
MKEYVLTERIKKRLESLGFPLMCHRCKKSLGLGDVVVSRTVTLSGKTARYHKKCYDDLFMELASENSFFCYCIRFAFSSL